MTECGCAPRIKLSMCGIGGFNDKTGELISVACPSRYCAVMVPLVDNKISEHDGMVPGRCPFIGVRVVGDTAEFFPDAPTGT